MSDLSEGVSVVIGRLEVSPLDLTIECPECGVDNSGFLSDPRGASFTCDNCDAVIFIKKDVEITFRNEESESE